MDKITLITGGARSGKSRFAMDMAEKESEFPVYLATARKWDADFEKRIKRHQLDRGAHWFTLEEEKHIGKLKLTGKTVVLDCITLWLNNIFHDNEYDIDKALSEAKKEWQELVNGNFRLIVVSNELGMGIHAENEISRKFSDLQGWMNQQIASQADEVILMVSGISVKIK